MGEDGFEPSKALPADLQSVPFGHSGIPPYYSGLQAFHQKNISNHRNMFSHAKALETPRSTAPVNRKSERAVSNTWSWWTDSNPRPADYKSAALPTELHQRIVENSLIIISNILSLVNSFTKFLWSRRQDLNLRHLGPKPSTLPN